MMIYIGQTLTANSWNDRELQGAFRDGSHANITIR